MNDFGAEMPAACVDCEVIMKGGWIWILQGDLSWRLDCFHSSVKCIESRVQAPKAVSILY